VGSSPRWRWIDLGSLAACALFAHGLLLLNDGLYWDDWLNYAHLKGGDWAALDRLASEAGMTPLNFGFLSLFAYLPGGVFAFKLAVFVLIVAIAWTAYAIALEVGLGRLQAWLIAVLAMVFPGFQDWVILTTASSILDYALFLIATLLLLRAERMSTRASWILRGVAAVLFFGSFSLNSLLVLYFAALLLLLIAVLRTTTLSKTLRARWPLAVGLLVLPFAFWAVSQLVFGASGLYAGYNRPGFSVTTITRAYKYFLRNGILEQLLQAGIAAGRPWVWPLIALLALASVIVWRRRLHPPLFSRKQQAIALGFGVVALVAAIFPYAVVGLSPSTNGWDTRHDLLVGLPLAVILVSAARYALAGGSLTVVATGLLGLLALGFAVAGIQDYVALQARWVTDRAVLQSLQQHPQDGAYSVYWVNDELPGRADYYRFYEWSIMLGQVYGDQSRIGLDVKSYDASFLGQTQFFSDRYHLANFDPRACQADIVIRPGRQASSPGQESLTYTFDRVFRPDQLNDYLNGVVNVQVSPRPAALATDCPA
jgi:hypothetical protein